MGCSTSKLDDEEAVQLCKDRKKFIKQAVEQRIQFASGHIAYIQSLKRVSAALRDYVEGDEPRVFFLDSYTTTTPPPFTPIKKLNPGFISISSKKPFSTPKPSETHTTFKVNYLRSGGGNPSSIAVEERPQSPETVRIESFYSPMHHFGIDGFFSMQSPPPMNNRPSFPPPSPPTSQWDFFWNPFTSLDTYGYPTRTSLDQMVMDDDEITRLRQVREEEGIPDLEEVESEEKEERKPERAKIDLMNCPREEVIVEDDVEETESETDTEHEIKGLCSHGSESVKVSEAKKSVELDVSNQDSAVVDREKKEETPGFTAYVNRRPTSMAEVVKGLEAQFLIVCNSANELSTMLEASKAQHCSTSNELTAAKMLNPVALFRSASSRSSSSRFFNNSSSSRDEGYESSTDVSEESCMLSGSHQSTLDRLYAWEKKLYEEVRSGERVRIAYEKKCVQLRNQDVKGEDPSVVDKTRATMRDLHTRIKVSIHSVESVSKRIETLRDEELQPQLLELIEGLARMWKVMAECHQTQKRTIDEAKLLLAGTPPKLAKHTDMLSPTEPHRLARSASNLETELRNWRACFESWIMSQRSYVHALTGWLLRCIRPDPETSKPPPFSPRRSSGAPPIFGICIQLDRFLDSLHEAPVIDGLDFFAAGVGSLYSQQLRDDSRRIPSGSKRFGGVGFSLDSRGNMEMVEIGQMEEEEEKVVVAEKTADEVAIRVLCAGMSVAVSSLMEFAFSSAEGYADLVKQWENAKPTCGSDTARV